jgi:hypothetical protein
MTRWRETYGLVALAPPGAPGCLSPGCAPGTHRRARDPLGTNVADAMTERGV